jgi:hypothetical protein
MSVKLLEIPTFSQLMFSTAPSVSLFVLNALTDAINTVFVVPEAGTYTSITIRQGVVTGTPGVVRVSVQGINSTGSADGTILSSGNAFADYTPISGNNNQVVVLTLTSPITFAENDQVMVVIAPNSGTWDVSNNCSFTSRVNSLFPLTRFPYAIEIDGGVATRLQVPGVCGFRDSTRSIGNSFTTTAATSNFSSTSSPDEHGGSFRFPAEMGNSVVISAISLYTRYVTAGGTCDIVFYQGTTEIYSFSVDLDRTQNTTEGIFKIPLPVPLTVNTATTYIVAMRAVSTFQVSLRYFDFLSAEDAQATNFLNSTWYQRTNLGAWTEITTRVAFMSLHITGIASSSSIKTPLGMNGGMRG